MLRIANRRPDGRTSAQGWNSTSAIHSVDQWNNIWVTQVDVSRRVEGKEARGSKGSKKGSKNEAKTGSPEEVKEEGSSGRIALTEDSLYTV